MGQVILAVKLDEQVYAKLAQQAQAERRAVADVAEEWLKEMADDQAWYWTTEWQAGAREADEDLRAGRFETFDNMDDFLATLDEPLA